MSFRKVATRENIHVSNDEDVNTPKRENYSLNAEFDSLGAGSRALPSSHSFRSVDDVASDTARAILRDARACDLEADEATMHFLHSQIGYLSDYDTAEIDRSSALSNPLNEKVGKRRTQPKKQKAGKKRPRRRERVWTETEKKNHLHPDLMKDVTRVFETMRVESIQENDVFLHPEGAMDIVQDAVQRQVMRRVTQSMKNVVPNLICEITQLATVINLVLSAPTWRIAMQCMYIYLCPRLAFNPEVTKDIMKFVADVFGDAFLKKEDALDSRATDTTDKHEENPGAIGWLLYIKDIRSNWTFAKEHPLFTNFTKFMSVMCYTGIVAIDKETWSSEVADAVMPGVQGICRNSRNLLDSILDIIEYVAQAAAIYIDTGDIHAAVADKDNGGLIYEIARVTSNHQKFKVGLLREGDDPITDDMHYNDLHELTTRLTRLMNNAKSLVQSNLYSTHLIKMQTLKMEVYAQLERSPSRAQPWSIYLNGPPGGGKSTLMSILAKACIDALEGEEWDSRRVYNRCATDAYWSKYRADMYGIYFNDVGASLDEAVLKRSYDEMLRVQDVARYYPPMPEAHEKGIPDTNNYFTMASGNGLFPFLAQCANDLSAYTRRYRLAPMIIPKNEFCTKNAAGNNYLDTGKINLARERGVLTGPFDETSDIYMFETRPGKVGVESVPIAIYGKHKLTVTEFVTFMVRDFLEHLQAQRAKLSKIKLMEKVEFDVTNHFEQITEDIPEKDRTTCAENRFLRESPVQTQVEALNQHEHESENTRSKRRTLRLHGKKGRKHSGVPYDLTPSQVTMAQHADLETFYAEMDDSLIPEGNVVGNLESHRKRNFQRVDVNNIIPLGANSAEFHEKWQWVPNWRLRREWLPDFLWRHVTPQDRMHISEACHQNMCVWSLFAVATTLGPMATVAPLGVCALACAAATSLGNIFLVNTGRKLHQTCLTTDESLFLASHWRRVDIHRIAGVTAVIILACQIFRSARTTSEGFVSEAADFEPTPLSDPHYRQLGVNPWNKEKDLVDADHLALTTQTTVSKDLLKVCDRVLYAGEVWRGTKDKVKVGTITGFVFHTGYMLVSAHYLTKMRKWADAPGNDPNTIYTLVMTRGELKKGSSFTITVDYRSYFTIEDGDVAVLKAVKTGKSANLIKHFPVKRRSIAATAFCVSRKPREEAETLSVRTSRQRSVTVPEVGTYTGFTYERESHYQGLCGAAIVSRGAKSHIMGFHTAGSSIKENLCVAAIVTQKDLYDAIEYYTTLDPGCIPLTKEDDLNMLDMLDGFVPGKEPHHKSPLRYTTDGAQFSVLGTTGKNSTFQSNARPTTIAESVGKHCGIDPSIYQPPVSKPSYFGPQNNADAAAVPADDFPDEALRWARKDLWETLNMVKEHFPHEHHPLTRFEVINGTGRMFEDAMNRQSVWGQPLSGVKAKDMFQNNDITYKPSAEYDGPIWDVDPSIHSLLDRIDAAYSKGADINPVFTSCVKDEIHTKPKARVFEVAPMPITMKGRELTLTTSSFLRLTTEYSECAVGANCHGLDGTFLYNRAVCFGVHRLIAGDFAKYDKRMPVSILLQSLSIYEQAIRDWWDLTDEQRSMRIQSFHGWKLDVVYPTVDFFGDVIQMRGGYFPSGVPITADLNGLSNSVIHRVVYYMSFVRKNGSPVNIPPFRTMVALLTYGDDSMGSVSVECDWFDMQVMSEICAEFGIVYTDPSKNSGAHLAKFLELEELDFLKRNFNSIHECGQRLGALSLKSFYKPLCMVLWDNKHALNMDELSIENMNGSMFEAFNHGRAFYNKHQAAMKEVAEECNIPMASIKQVYRSFDERLVAWHEQYGAQVEYVHSLSV